MGRKKLNRTIMTSRVDIQTPETIKKIAQVLGYVYDNEGSSGKLLDAIAKRGGEAPIASGELILIDVMLNPSLRSRAGSAIAQCKRKAQATYANALYAFPLSLHLDYI
jgi:hypothetical protein